MISVPHALQLQLSEAVTIIADNDFPHQWNNLLQDLISKLSVVDLKVNVGVLQTAHSIFKRWRHQFRSDTLFTEIKFVLEQFAAPYLAFFKAIDQLVDENANNSQNLLVLMETLLLLSKIFYSLNCQDLPEFFEDNQNEFMNLFHKYLVYQSNVLPSVININDRMIKKLVSWKRSSLLFVKLLIYMPVCMKMISLAYPSLFKPFGQS